MKMIADIRAFANGGEAVGTLENGKTVFVRGAVPGEKIEVEIYQDKKRYARGRLIQILNSSQRRINTDCTNFPECPGCSYRHVDYRFELEWKQKQLEYLLRDFSEIRYDDPVGSSSRCNWRNKLTLHVENGKCGYRGDDNNTIIPVTTCPIAKQEINAAISQITTGVSESITLRYTSQDKVVQLRRGKHDNRVLTENLGKFGKFRVGADGFFQTNLEIAEKLITEVVNELEIQQYQNLLELYCGVGVFSISCAEAFPQLQTWAVELDKGAIRSSKRNAMEHGVSERCKFYSGDAGEIFGKILPQIPKEYLLLVDPPRTGMDKDMIDWILKAEPKSLIYISCGADTLARDVRLLEGKYKLERVRLFDMFPGTGHFETFAVLHTRSI